MIAPVRPLPPPKQHTFKYQLPRLGSYVAEEVPKQYWDSWWKRPLRLAMTEAQSWIDPVCLRKAAVARGIPVGETLEFVCTMLRDGAVLGCEGRGRLPTRGSNAKKVLQHADVICDTLQDWVVQGIAAGPLTLAEVEEEFGDDYTVNALSTRPKPNGSLRIIVDMSGPRDEDTTVPGWIYAPTLPGAVNTTIDPNQFPARMSSLKIFIRMLYNVGRGAVVCKVDWKDAYKHLKVCKEDLKLQLIQFAGRFFVELRLVFGARSSPGLFDMVSDVLKDLAILDSSILATLVTKHLDDILAVGRNSSDDPVYKFFAAYIKLAEEIGVRLPPVDVDKTKVQSPQTTVVALGMDFDTITWQVKCPEFKLGRMLHTVRQGLAVGSIPAAELHSLVGQLQDKLFMVEGARFHIGELFALIDMDKQPEELVRLTDEAREMLRWWFASLQVSAWYCPIMHPEAKLWPPLGSAEVDTDAAGGSLINLRAGVGVLLPSGQWTWAPWARWLQAGLPGPDGRPLNAQMLTLELCGPLIALAVGGSVLRNRAVKFRMDNMSAVYTWRKGYSSKDKLASTLVKAIFDLATRLNCKPFICKVARCSTKGAMAADMISKGAFFSFLIFGFTLFLCVGDIKGFYKLCPGSPVDPLPIPVALLQWLQAPKVDYGLGMKIAEELGRKGESVLRE